jgi:hypothetical protein
MTRTLHYFIIAATATAFCGVSGCATSGKIDYPEADAESQLIQRAETVRTMSKSPYVQ